MRSQDYDVIVVGCGPGGALAGKFAALGGAKTLVVENRRRPGFPVHDSMAIIYSQSEMQEVTGEKIDPGAKMEIPVVASLNSATTRASKLGADLGVATVGYARGNKLSVLPLSCPMLR